jgi:hypothetical protein
LNTVKGALVVVQGKVLESAERWVGWVVVLSAGNPNSNDKSGNKRRGSSMLTPAISIIAPMQHAWKAEVTPSGKEDRE